MLCGLRSSPGGKLGRWTYTGRGQAGVVEAASHVHKGAAYNGGMPELMARQDEVEAAGQQPLRVLEVIEEEARGVGAEGPAPDA